MSCRWSRKRFLLFTCWGGIYFHCHLPLLPNIIAVIFNEQTRLVLTFDSTLTNKPQPISVNNCYLFVFDFIYKSFTFRFRMRSCCCFHLIEWNDRWTATNGSIIYMRRQFGGSSTSDITEWTRFSREGNNWDLVLMNLLLRLVKKLNES